MVHKVFIYGSCVSRDTVELLDPGHFDLTSYFARSVMASAFSPTSVRDNYSSSLKSSFQKTQVRNDFCKKLPLALASTAFDTLLIDFIDERFPLFEYHSGAVVTISVELHSLGVLTPDMGRTITAYSDDHFLRWLDGWRSFVELAKRESFLDKVAVNRAYWAFSDVNGTPIANVSPNTIRRANRYLSRLYDECAKELPQSQFIAYPSTVIRGDASHKWGAAPFHYGRTFYETTVDFLECRRRQAAEVLQAASFRAQPTGGGCQTV